MSLQTESPCQISLTLLVLLEIPPVHQHEAEHCLCNRDTTVKRRGNAEGGRCCDYPSGVKNSTRILCWWHTQRPKGGSCHPELQSCATDFPHFIVAVDLVDHFDHYAWWHMEVPRGLDAEDYLPSACCMQNLLEYISCLSGTQNVKKSAKLLTGCLVINNLLYSQKFYNSSSWVIFIIHNVISCGKRRWEPLETLGWTRREGVRWPEYLHRALAMAMWWRWFIAAWDPSPAHLTHGSWKSGNPSHTN